MVLGEAGATNSDGGTTCPREGVLPGGMCTGAGGKFEGQRFPDSRFAISDFCFRFDMAALVYDKGGGFPPRQLDAYIYLYICIYIDG